jgi:PhnB protein
VSENATQTSYQTVVPYLIVPGVPDLMGFLTKVFGADEIQRHLSPDGHVVHAEVRIGDSIVMMAEAAGELQAMPTTLHLLVDDVDATYAHALRAGAASLRAPADQPYGYRNAGVRDASGNHWWITAPIARERVSPRA